MAFIELVVYLTFCGSNLCVSDVEKCEKISEFESTKSWKVLWRCIHVLAQLQIESAGMLPQKRTLIVASWFDIDHVCYIAINVSFHFWGVFYLLLQRSQKEEVTSKMGGGRCVSCRNFYKAFDVCTHMTFKLVGWM
jgi:hypothetical protein